MELSIVLFTLVVVRVGGFVGAMPLFGLILEGPSEAILAPDGSEVIAPEAIVDIAAWLQTVQKEN